MEHWVRCRTMLGLASYVPCLVVRARAEEPGWFRRFRDEDFIPVKAAIQERMSATRQASRIGRRDLDLALAAIKLRVLPAQDSPSLSDLLDGDMEEGAAGFW
jgi:hypothetical protein